MITQERKNHRRWLAPLMWTIGVLVAVVVLLKSNSTAREVAGESALVIFQILTAPFVLETTLVILGLCAVFAINHYRQQKEGDEWVYLQKQEPSAGSDAETDDPPHRHDAVVWHEKPDDFDEAAAGFEVIEGYMDLGLADDALQELASLPQRLRQEERADDFFVRALAMAGKMSQATSVLDESAKTHPGRSQRLSVTALSVAIWLHDNGKARAEIDQWLRRSQQLDPRSVEKLPAGHALREWSGKEG